MKIRVATYNIGNFTGENYAPGSEDGKREIRKALSDVNADLWGLQEDVEFYSQETSQRPYSAIYDGYKYYERRGVKRYNYKAFLSNYEIKDVEQIYYKSDVEFYGNYAFAHPWFLRGTIDVDGIKICVITLHFDWSDNSARAEQIKQVIDYASKFERVVITGDFNTVDYVQKVKQSKRSLFLDETKIFTDAGFKTANGGEFGIFNTYVEYKDNHCPLDNILVRGGLEIKKVELYLAEYMNDHAILWADLIVK